MLFIWLHALVGVALGALAIRVRVVGFVMPVYLILVALFLIASGHPILPAIGWAVLFLTALQIGNIAGGIFLRAAEAPASSKRARPMRRRGSLRPLVKASPRGATRT